MRVCGVSWILVFLCACSWGTILPGRPVEEPVPSHPIATQIYDAEDLAFDPEGRLFVSSADGVYVITGLSGDSVRPTVSKVVDSGAIFAGLAIGPDGYLYAACFHRMKTRILRINPGERPFSSSTYLEGEIKIPNGLRFDDAGMLYAADYGLSTPGSGRILRIEPDPAHPDRAGKVACVARGLWAPNSIVIDRDRERLYFTETFSGRIYYLEQGWQGGFLTEPRLLVNVGIVGPRFPILDGMALDAQGCLYVCVYNKNLILVVSPEGNLVRSLVPRGALHPTALAFGIGEKGKQCLYVTEKGHMFLRDRSSGDRLIRMDDVDEPYRLPFLGSGAEDRRRGLEEAATQTLDRRL